MQLYIMTGQTELAVETFAACQSVENEFPMKTGRGIIEYLDNAAVICALTGDFEEANKYIQAMHNFSDRDSKDHIADIYPYLTEIKVLYLEGKCYEAMGKLPLVSAMIDNCPGYLNAWEKEYMRTLLHRTRLFDIFPEQIQAEQDRMAVFDAEVLRLKEAESQKLQMPEI